MNPAKQLDQLARLQQMQLNARLAALEAATKLLHAPTYASGADLITLIATATEIQGYILGNIEAETEQALKAAEAKLNGPRIVRP